MNCISDIEEYKAYLKDKSVKELLEISQGIDRDRYPTRYEIVTGLISKNRPRQTYPSEKSLEDIENQADTVKLKAFSSIFIVFSYFVVKYLAAIIFSIILLLYKAIRTGSWESGLHLLESRAVTIINEHFHSVILFELITSCIVLYLLSRIFASNLIKVKGDHGIGWTWSGFDLIWISAVLGCVLAGILLFLSSGKVIGHLTNNLKMSFSFQYMSLVISIVILGPIIEEYLFRGVLYAGLTNSWGKEVSFVLVTLVFVLVHLPMVDYKILPLVSILSLGIVSIKLRDLSGVLGPSIILHMFYNLTVVCYQSLKAV